MTTAVDHPHEITPAIVAIVGTIAVCLAAFIAQLNTAHVIAGWEQAALSLWVVGLFLQVGAVGLAWKRRHKQESFPS